MVSLGNENGGRGAGAYFFDLENSLNTADTEELVSDQTVLSADNDPPFRRIHTTWAIIVQILLMVCLEVAVFLLPYLCNGHTCNGISAYSTIVYAHAVLWFFNMLLDRFLRYQHYISRRNGYLEFYRATRFIRRAPFMVLSGGNAMLVILLKLLEDYCPDKQVNTQCAKSFPLSRANYLQILISIEFIVSIVCLVIYLVKTVKFNRFASAPDVHQDEIMTSFLQSQNHTATDIGFRDEDYLDQVLEKQADMIRYLKQHNAHLGHKILRLTQQLNQRTNNQLSQ